MKRNLVLVCLLISAAGMGQKSFTVKGSVSNMSKPVTKVLIYYRADSKNISDSVEPVNGAYTFTGKIDEPTQATLLAKYAMPADGKPVRPVSGRDFATVFLEPGTIQISSVDSFGNVTVKGSKANDEYIKLTNLMKPLNAQVRDASAAYSKAAAAKDEPARKAAEAVIDSLDNVSREMYGSWARNNLQSPLALYAITQYAGWAIDVDAVEPLFKQIPAEQREYASAKTLAANIEIARKTKIGAMAMDFTQEDTLGVPVKLSSFRGKYLLVDFWASWCGPCRRENPNVVKAFNEFKDKNFTILSVSLDRPGAKEQWIDAIHKDNLTWTHVSDLKFWQNGVAQQYGIQAIPQNLLLDPSGKIIAKNLNGEQLEKKLATLLHP
ncbi:MAG: AhpC/TSA family protein [Chitinophagaceae bacterium]|nr:AhpC/TSA family protein [Chitinophagaceae bacterium]